MLNIDYRKSFIKYLTKIQDKKVQDKIKKQIEKIVENPEIGKPMRYSRKGTRELYVSPHRIAYSYLPSQQTLIFLDIYYKDQQ